MAKILCVLYDDPIDGYPRDYARDDLPIERGFPFEQCVKSRAQPATKMRGGECETENQHRFDHAWSALFTEKGTPPA